MCIDAASVLSIGEYMVASGLGVMGLVFDGGMKG